jgi:hypothetical protein
MEMATKNTKNHKKRVFGVCPQKPQKPQKTERSEKREGFSGSVPKGFRGLSPKTLVEIATKNTKNHRKFPGFRQDDKIDKIALENGIL